MILLIILCFIGKLYALRLHSGKTSPMQLFMQLGNYVDEAGLIIMNSVDLEKCFPDVINLIKPKNLPFLSYSQQVCGKRFSLRTIANFGRERGRVELKFASTIGLDCLASIHGFGTIFPAYDLSLKPLLKPTKLINFSQFQVDSVLAGAAGSEANIDVLSLGFVLMNGFESHGPFRNLSLLKHSRSLVDAMFIQSNPAIGLALLRSLCHIKIEGTSMQLQDLISRKSTSISVLAGKYFQDPWNVLDMISRFMQLGTIYIYASWTHSRNHRMSPAVGAVKDCVGVLAEFVTRYASSKEDWAIELLTATEMVKSIINSDIVHEKLNSLIKKMRINHIFDYYMNLREMTSYIMHVEGFDTKKNIEIINRLHVETLIVLSEFEASDNLMKVFVGELLSPRSIRGISLIPRSRHLLMLARALIGNTQVFKEANIMIMAHIMRSIPEGSDLSVVVDFGLANFLPWKDKQDLIKRKCVSIMESMDISLMYTTDYLIESIKGKIPTESDGIRPKSHAIAENGYLDVDVNRSATAKVVLCILKEHFVYCGHNGDLPVYIQSLGMHPFIYELFIQVLIHARALGLHLPFSLHPIMLKVMQFPGRRRLQNSFVQTAMPIEFSEDNLNGHQFLRHIVRFMTLVEQMKIMEVVDPELDPAVDVVFDEWIKRTDFLFEQILTGMIKTDNILEAFKATSTQDLMDLANFSVTKVDFSELFGFGMTQREGLSLLFGLSDDKIKMV